MSSRDSCRYRAVVFDFDGTLADTRPAITACMTETFARHRHPRPSNDAIRGTIGATLADSLRALGAPPDELDAWTGTYRQLYAAHGLAASTLYPAARDTIITLRRLGRHVAIASNKGADAITEFLTTAGLDLTAIALYAGNTHRYTKPDPRLMHDEILTHWPELTAADVLVVGDTTTDIRFAHTAGSPACWASYGYGNPDTCQRLNPEHTANALTEIPHLV